MSEDIGNRIERVDKQRILIRKLANHFWYFGDRDDAVPLSATIFERLILTSICSRDSLQRCRSVRFRKSVIRGIPDKVPSLGVTARLIAERFTTLR